MMTNLLNGAHVANKLFSTIARLRLLLVMFLTLSVSANVWAEKVTFLPNELTAVTSKDYSHTKENITIAVTASTVTADEFRIFKNQTLTISTTNDNKITGVEITCTKENTTKYGPGCFGNYDGYSYSSYVGTWSGSANSISLNASEDQVRATSIVVTYSSGGGDPIDPTTYTINWHTAVGTVVDEVLEEGATITKPATDPKMTGYEFMGWTEDCEVASDGAGFTAITNFGTATEDKDYYAVFAKATTTGGGGGSTTETLKGNQLSYSGTNGYVNFTATTTSGTWSGKANYNKNGYIQINKNNNNYHIGSPTFASNVTSIKITTTNNSAASRTFYICSSNSTAQPSSGDLGSHTTTTTNESFTIDLTKEAKQFYIYSSGAVYISQIDVTYSGGGGSTTYDNYRTTCSAQPSRCVTHKMRG